MLTFCLAGVEVPRVGLGTNRLTIDNVTFVREAVAAGVRHIDPAHLYTGGESERAIGEALQGVSEDVLVATKGGYRGASPDTLEAEIEQSLRSLLPIPGTRSIQHLRENLAALELDLGDVAA